MERERDDEALRRDGAGSAPFTEAQVQWIGRRIGSAVEGALNGYDLIMSTRRAKEDSVVASRAREESDAAIGMHLLALEKWLKGDSYKLR